MESSLLLPSPTIGGRGEGNRYCIISGAFAVSSSSSLSFLVPLFLSFDPSSFLLLISLLNVIMRPSWFDKLPSRWLFHSHGTVHKVEYRRRILPPFFGMIFISPEFMSRFILAPRFPPPPSSCMEIHGDEINQFKGSSGEVETRHFIPNFLAQSPCSKFE